MSVSPAVAALQPVRLDAPAAEVRSLVGIANATNDTMATAGNLGSVTARTVTQTGSVGGTDPRDYFKFTISRTQTVVVKLSGLSADIDVALLNASGSQLGAGTKGGASSEVVAKVLNAGTYYVKVFPGVTGARSNYTLSVQGADPGNDLMSGATNFGEVRDTTITKTGAVGGADPVDYWKFVPQSRAFFLTGKMGVGIELTGMTSDLDIFVLDSRGNILGRGTKSGTANERVSLELYQGTQYFIKIVPHDPGVASNYSLKISAGMVR